MELDRRPSFLAGGSVFHDRYEVIRCIKAGGMGAVYEVIHLETRRRRALKVMLPAILENLDLRARFRLEATIAADIESEHIVETFDAGIDSETGAPFLVMELLRGEDLGAIVKKRGKLLPGEVVTLLSQLASALDKTHSAGVIHRDLKPENLFLTRRDDGSPKLKILDFGIAKIVSESGQPVGKTKVLGTPVYMSPEQIRGDGRVGPRADLYALAQIAFTLLVGRAYWADESDALELYALLTRIIGGAPQPVVARAAKYGRALPPAFGDWFAKATRVVPEERFTSAAETVEALAGSLGVALPHAAAMGAGEDPGRADSSRTRPISKRGLETIGSPDVATVPMPSEPLLATRELPATISSQASAPSLHTLTAALSSVVVAPPPKRRPAGKLLAFAGIAAALVVLGVVLNSFPGGASKPAVGTEATELALPPRPSPAIAAPSATSSAEAVGAPSSSALMPAASARAVAKVGSSPRPANPLGAKPSVTPPSSAASAPPPKRSLE